MSEPAFNVADFARQQAEQHQRLVRAGMEIADEKFHTRIRALEAAYQQACLDPQTKLPSYLMATMVSMFNMLPERYVDAMVNRDQFARHEGRADHDMTTSGMPMKAGQ